MPSRVIACAALLLFSALASPGGATLLWDASVTHHWLNFPISSAVAKQRITVFSNGMLVRTFDAQLALGKPEWWVAMDISAWKGTRLTVRGDAPPTPNSLAPLLDESDSRRDEAGLYQEALRPLFHFSARRGHLNDPNGLVYCDGQYHIFFQHYPFTWTSGLNHWGHAVSTDLIHWHQKEEALFPDKFGGMWSGSAVVDRHNTSGLVPGAKTPIVAIYTAFGAGPLVCLAYTTDGLTFTKYSGNPIIPSIASPNRDPKVFWYGPGHHWVLVLYVGILDPAPHTGFRDHHTLRIYVSDNLRDWQQTDTVDGGIGDDGFLYECPDLFPIAWEGHPGQVKWILEGGNGLYDVGKFDGRKFTPEATRLPSHYGSNFYAGQTFNNMPGGRVVQIGWMRAQTPGMPFDQCLSIPLEFALKDTPQGPRLFPSPIKELEQLRGAPKTFAAGALNPGDNPLAGLEEEGMDLEADLKPGSAEKIIFNFHGVPIEYHAADRTIHCEAFTAPVTLADGSLHLRILLDRTTIDIFAGKDAVYLPVAILPDAADRKLSLTVEGGSAQIVSLRLYPMKSQWAGVMPK
jgi:fructan beta-fructosidase